MELEQKNKYIRTIIGLCGTPVKIDVYRVIDAFSVIDGAGQHELKKICAPGDRGHKSKREDLVDIIQSAQSALVLYDQKMAIQNRGGNA